MSTFMAKANEVERKWYLIDAEGKTLGSVAVQAAVLLRGKNKAIFTPHVDCGDHVVIINASKIVLTGKKATDKMYYHHTGYIGNMKKVQYGKLLETKPEFVITKAVKGMIPDTTLGRAALTRLRVYAGAEHEQVAQKPEKIEF